MNLTLKFRLLQKIGKYEVIINEVKKRGWKLVKSVGGEEGKGCSNDDLASCNVHWVDVAIVNERLMKMAPWQRFNHFPGMTNIARKVKMAQNLEKMRREVGFHTISFIPFPIISHKLSLIVS